MQIVAAAGNQWNARVAADGRDGAFIVWQDRRGGTTDQIYLQRVGPNGNVLWQDQGVPIAATGGFQYNPQLLPDGFGGVFVVWQDNRSGVDYDIYAQHLDPNGNALWQQNGVAVCAATGHQYNPQLMSDRVGGIVAAWQDRRAGQFDIYAQRINVSGSPLWTTDGILICGNGADQVEPKIAGDGSGGAFIGWLDYRKGTGSTDIYAQHIISLGTTTWTPDGLPVCTAPNLQWNLQAARDGASGVVFVWEDRRSGSVDNIFAQRLDASGNALWGADGLQIAPSAGYQSYPQVAADGGGGYVFVWQDNRTGSDYDIYAQRLDGIGSLLWGPGGAAVCASPGHQYYPQVVAQGGSAFFTWQDHRGPDFDIYAQRFDLLARTFWPAEGAPVATMQYDQIMPQLASDGHEGGIIAWPDYHLNSGSTDIYAHRIGANGLPAGGCYRTFSQDSLNAKAAKFKKSRGQIIGKPNVGNVRDSIFARGVFPDGMTMGYERPDSAKRFGWIFYTKSTYLKRALPQWATPRPLAKLLDKDFVGKLRNPSNLRYNNRFLGELVALKLNIGASDAGLTPGQFGDLLYLDSSQTGALINNRTLRGMLPLLDSLLTYYRQFTGVNYSYLANVLHNFNTAFEGPIDTISTSPLRIKPTKALFSVAGLVPGLSAPAPPPAFTPLAPDAPLPNKYVLQQNYPNPFNPFTTIEFSLPEPAVVTLDVYNMLGQKIATLVDRVSMDDGQQILDFDATNLASGVYFYRLYAEPASGEKPLSLVKKMMVLK